MWERLTNQRTGPETIETIEQSGTVLDLLQGSSEPNLGFDRQ